MVAGIKIEKNPDKSKLDKLGVESWPIWTSPIDTFDWEYSTNETCYILEGKVIVHTAEGDVTVEAGDLVTFPKGLKCTWEVIEPIRKHYTFG